MKKKICRMDNATLTWVMYVDNHVIIVNSGADAEYFTSHYEKLGYKIKLTESYKNIG